MSVPADNPGVVLSTLDGLLDHEVPLVIFGRGALWLGFDHARPEFGTTEDVDGIIRAVQLEELVKDDAFWDAVDATNEKLKPKGLYITHLFQEDQIFLRPDWWRHIVPVRRPMMKFLRLFRPHAVDFILTKMMRGADIQDMQDVDFLIRHDRITAADMEPAFAQVRMPDIQELHDAFARALPAVRALLASAAVEDYHLPHRLS